MAASKYRWKIQPRETGHMAWVHRRAWPKATTADGVDLAKIVCEDPYTPRAARAGDHASLQVRIRCGVPEPERGARGRWEWKRITVQFATLDAAKTGFAGWLTRHPDHDFGIDPGPGVQ